MADYLAIDLNKFENQMMNFLEVYYSILQKEPLIPFKKENSTIWKDKMINLLEKFKDTKRIGLKNCIEGNIKLLNEATKNGIFNLEFYIIMSVTETLFEIYVDKEYPIQKKTAESIKKIMSRCIFRELIELRNELSHNENPPSELILRFYEDQYYLIKFMKPNNSQIELSNYITHDLKINIHMNLANNLNNQNSFELYPLKEEFIKFETENKINDNNPKNIIINGDTKEAIKSLFKFTPIKLPNFEFTNKNNDKEKSQLNVSVSNSKDNNDDEEKEVYEKSIENSSRNSIIAFSDSMSSERSSITDNIEGPQNIKEESLANITNMSKASDVQENM